MTHQYQVYVPQHLRRVTLCFPRLDRRTNRSAVPLKKDMRYCVKFNLSLAEASKYASNNIGAKLSKKPFGSDSKLPLIDEASLLHYDNDHKIMSARYNWTEVCGVVVAEGGEKYITIGNFNSTQHCFIKASTSVGKTPVFCGSSPVFT